MKLSNRIGRVGASPTLAISAKAKAMRKAGEDVIGFGAGEPDFDTPEPIKEAARAALAAGKTKYTPPAGEVELRQGLADHYRERYGLSYAVDQVFVSNGGKHTLFNLFAALLSPGDEVIVVAPYWVSYPAQVLLADGKPVVVGSSAQDNFCPSPEALDAALTDRTRAVVFNSPGNPTGAVWSREQMDGLVGWLKAHPEVLAINDGIYAELVYGDARYYELAALDPALHDQVVCVSGVSKTYAMTGWRIGWALGPEKWIKGAAKFQSQTTSGPNTIAQWAALEALTIDPEIIAHMRTTYDRRRLLTCRLLREVPGVELAEPQGAFYAFPDLTAYMGGQGPNGVIEDDLALATYLLESVGVALVPGSAFGAPGFVRITYACDDDTISRGISRIADALGKVTRVGP